MHTVCEHQPDVAIVDIRMPPKLELLPAPDDHRRVLAVLVRIRG
jgi:hypothetical protein